MRSKAMLVGTAASAMMGCLVIYSLAPAAAQDAGAEGKKMALCLSHIKQLATGALLYRSDWDDMLWKRGASAQPAVNPYLRNQSPWTCPSDAKGTMSYTFNDRLLGIPSTMLRKPGQTVLVYEGRAGKLNMRHLGMGALAFDDSSAKMVGGREARSLHWTVK